MDVKFIVSVGSHKIGDTLSLPKKKALQFVGAGFAEEYTEKPKRKAKPKTRSKKNDNPPR